MKKNISVFFAFFAFVLCISLMLCFKIDKVSAISENSVLTCNSASAYLCDANSKTVIYKQNETKRMPIASMCKVMTLNICFDEIKNNNLSFDEMIDVSNNASGMGGSQVFLESNAKYKCSELIKSIVVSSANDASMAMAERIAGSEQAFVNLMNEKCAKLNMENTNFVNCTGLPKSGQYSCAKDVATMFGELIKNEEYFKFSTIWMDKIEHPNERFTEISNTNKLVRFYQGCDSGKTGYTNEAGHCLVASAKRNDMRLISVVIKAPDSKTRFSDVSSMFNYGFANYVNKVIIDSKKPYDAMLNVEHGKKDRIQICVERDVCIFTQKNEKLALDIEFTPQKNVAPIVKGEKVGEIVIYNNGLKIDSVNVLALEDVATKSYLDITLDVINNWAL